jgi:protein required for attachment to host cells
VTQAMHPIWVVVADAGHARFLQRVKPRAPLEEVGKLEDELAHAPGRELRRDAHGRYYGKGEREMAHTAVPHTDPHKKEAQRFARRVAERLEQAYREHLYDHLVIAAAPAFLGMLREALPETVRKTVIDEVDADLVPLDVRAIDARLPSSRRAIL